MGVFSFMRGLLVGSVGLAAAAGCGSDGSSPGDTEGTTSTSTGTDTLGTTTLDSMTSGVDSTGGADEGDPMGECFLWDTEKCGADLKCMPWSDSPDRIPDETRCCAAMENPDFEGETCTISEYDGSCLDSCEIGTMCVLDDAEALSGLCRRFCNPSQPDCTQDQTCKAFFEALPLVPNIPMCMAHCDPVVQDCPENGWKCIPDTPTESGQSGFICVPPPPDTPNQLFDACALANDCEAGLVCITQERVPGCTFAQCCSAFCSLSEGDAVCQALHPDMRCIDWMSPDPKWADVGACAIPQ